MNIVGTSNNSKNIVSLEELVPQHDCLKLLILHTPYTLVISTLNLCVNLVKLDLSKNNLEHFPYLGSLANLKFMFIHQNKLDVAGLKNIFQLNGKKSNLSQNIVWVTYWGNKNSFLGRHYLVNETNAIAIDKNMVVQQQRSPNFPYDYYEPFCEETDLSDYFDRKSGVNRFASEQEYMKQLWLQMSELRKRHEMLFPLIKIQKIFRGWIVRVKQQRISKAKKEYFQVIKTYFSQWMKYSKRNEKLRRILKRKRKQFLLLDIKEMKKQQKIYKMVQIAQEIKKKFLNHKISLKNQFRFYNIVRQNYLKLKNLYTEINVSLSQSIYISKHQWQLFEQMIMPFLKAVNKQEVVPLQNQDFCLHLLYEFHNEKSKEFIKIMLTNIKSLVYDGRHHSQQLKKKTRKPLLYGCSLKQIYRTVHISNHKKTCLQSMMTKIQEKRQIGRSELIKIKGSQLLLKDIVRGIYFFNTGRLQNVNQNNIRIHVLTQYSLIKIVSVIKIQKLWRGYSFRKKNGASIKSLLKSQRAAIIIQRWIRKMPNYKKTNFMYSIAKSLQQVKQSKFYIQAEDYFRFLESKLTNPQSYIFQQLDTRVYLHQQSNSLCIGWNNQSENMQILQNIRLKKCLFNRMFLANKVALTQDQINTKIIYDQTKHVACSYAHIFHYGTESTLITKGKKKYLQVKCSSKNEAKFRIFILLLTTYQLNKKSKFPIYYSQLFKHKDLLVRAELGKNYGNFICNENFSLIKQCEVMFRNEPRVSLHVINNKFYFQSEEKPVKLQEKFFIYTYDLQEEQAHTENIDEIKQQKAYRTEKSKTLQGQFRFMTENMGDNEIESLHQQTQPTKKLKIIMKKRSVKQYKIEKKAKSKKREYPSFMLDSMSIKDRLPTQPDILVTQGSQQNNSLQPNLQASAEKHNANLKAKHRMTYAQKRNNSFKKKQEQNFTRRLVNLGNFIQNQYANDYRRRIKTEMENRAADSADYVRRQIERSQSHKIQQSQQKYKKVREKHVQHRQLIQKTQSLMRQRSLQTKTEVNQAKDKRIKERSKLRRLKVSFAQECYPLASKHKKYQYFP